MLGHVTTAARAVTATIMGAALATTMAVDLTRTMDTTRAGRGYNNYYSYYTPTYGYNASMVVAVQRPLGQLGYYHGVVDGVVGPQTRGAIAAFESRNGLAVDGSISGRLLNELGLAS